MNPSDKIKFLQKNIESIVLGKSESIKLAIITLIAKGHLLIEDVPGVGKTTLARSLAKSLNCSFMRIQFTSDLLPSDILGVSIFNRQKSEFEFKKGPIFANIILADEINRTTPKTQSCLLQAMNDGQVSIDSVTYPLPRPFMVIATQNPIEFHGTYPLPESQIDRFMMRIKMGYPPLKDEKRIVQIPNLFHSVDELHSVISSDDLIELQKLADNVKIDDSLISYIMSIVSETRKSEMVELGVSPRGAIQLYKAAQSKAIVEDRDYCIPDDIKDLAKSVLSHRIIPKSKFNSLGRNIGEAEKIIEEILEKIPVPI